MVEIGCETLFLDRFFYIKIIIFETSCVAQSKMNGIQHCAFSKCRALKTLKVLKNVFLKDI